MNNILNLLEQKGVSSLNFCKTNALDTQLYISINLIVSHIYSVYMHERLNLLEQKGPQEIIQHNT